MSALRIAVHNPADRASSHEPERMNHFEPPRDGRGRTDPKTSPAIARLRRTMGHIAPSVFLREWIHDPATVGAVWPSSGRLARRMAACVPHGGEGLVIELGAGTGAVTRALLARGIAEHRLLVVERSPNFVRHLRRKFPSVTVLQGDALRLAELVPSGLPVDAIVSSLPLRSLPRTDARNIVAQWQQVLRTGGRAVQFTYDLRNRLHYEPSGLQRHSSHLVWANVPPARVFTLTAGH
jgi:phospholipid N-methyltransferase